MKRSRFSEEQIIAILKEQEGVVRLTGLGIVSALSVLANSLGSVPGSLLFGLIERPNRRRSLSD